MQMNGQERTEFLECELARIRLRYLIEESPPSLRALQIKPPAIVSVLRSALSQLMIAAIRFSSMFQRIL
jgi:hypothetical protein